jgi:ubiquinone/menaquinone biosynthesis C-methylase UbiE
MVARADAGSDERAPLTDLLRCPKCGAGVAFEAAEVVCRNEGHRFPLVDGIPVLIDEVTLASNPQYEHQRHYFDAEFTQYERYELERWRVSYLARLRSAGLLGTAGAPLVDVGVGGSGYTVVEAARAGQHAVGCDLSLDGLLAARRFAVSEGVAERTLWVCCSAEKLPLASASFASALAIAVIEHVPDDTAALSEMARVLQPEGGAWVTVPHALRNIAPIFRLPNRRHDRRLGHLRRYEAEALVQVGRQLGLNAKEIQFTGHSIKVLQLVGARFLPERLADRFWWWCETLDLRRRRTRRGSMQLSILFAREP